MNKLNLLAGGAMLLLLSLSACKAGKQQDDLQAMIAHGLDVATEQSLSMARQLENEEGRLPRSVKDGKLDTSDNQCWCSGFYPGVLWYLYENAPQPQLLKYARLYTERLESVQYITSHHDVGFMLCCSYGNGYRLTQNPAYRKVLVTGSNSLCTRYDERVGAICSWEFNKHIWQYPVIIDNMMNLELLMWASKETAKPRYRQIAVNHANKTMSNHFRQDYSSYHVVSYDTLTGTPHAKVTHQGYADESAWARGQVWALYGFTMMARETGNRAYLEQAKHVAHYLMSHPRMPADKVPYWDFDAPDIPNVPRDASAAAIMASALIELSQLDHSDCSAQYLDYAKEQLRSLSSPEYLAEPGTNNHFILKHSTGHHPNGTEIDVPISYADYYYVEALMRMKKLLADSQTSIK